jgi:argininosuccinate lyase
VSLRDGRFGEPASGAFAKINASVDFDRRLYREDIRGSVAYAKALRRGGFLSAAQERAIVEGLRSIEREIEGGAFLFREEDEDIHMNIERRLFETIGEAAGRLHTGRSRNEQIVLDERLYLAGVLDSLEGKMKGLLNALASKARATIRVVVPSYTHMMPAQAVSLAHIFLAYYHALARDSERMGDYRKRLMIMPLGSGAVAGSSIGIDREPLKEELGFESLSRNSVDAVSTRDFIAEFLFICASVFVTLSRMAEDMIINASEERGFFTIPDSLSTTSSLMPQKKNPDSLELIRGKSARVIGNLMSSLVMMKALPYSYNRDLQEDKEGLFDTVDAALACVQVMTEVVDGLEVNGGRIEEVLARSRGFLFATDLADYLVGKGVPFRDAHRAVGALVRAAVEKGRSLDRLSLEDFRKCSAQFGEDVFGVFDYRKSVDRHDVPGGTAFGRVEEELSRIEGELAGGV